jgi:hypothetical protein
MLSRNKTTAKTNQDNIGQLASRAQENASRAADGLREYQLELISAAQANVNALFEYMQKAVQAQSISELMEVSNAHSRRQFEMIADQTRELAASAQKMATGSAVLPLTGIFSQGAHIS